MEATDIPPSLDARIRFAINIPKIEGCEVLANETFPGSRGPSHRNHRVWDVLYRKLD